VFAKSVDYSTGHVQVFFSPHLTSLAPVCHVIVLPLGVFLDVFSDPKKLEQGLHRHCKDVLEEWEALNAEADSLGQRTNVERVFTLHRHEWKVGYGPSHFSEFEMQINSWGFTAANNNTADPPPIEQKDLKVSENTFL